MSKRRSHAQAASGRGARKSFKGRSPSGPRNQIANVRDAAAWVVERSLDSLSPSGVFLDSALKRLQEPDHGLLRELALGTLRWLRRLDHVIEEAAHRPIDRIDPALRAPLRVGAYQLLFLDRVPPHAAVHEAVEHARRVTHKGGASFTNAVLRRIGRTPELASWPVEHRSEVSRLAIEKSHPDFLVERWLDRLGEERTRDLLDANNRPKSLQLLAFCDRGGREMLAESLIDMGVAVEPSSLTPQGLVVRAGNPLHSEAYHRGEFYIQDEASQAAALVPPPRPGERIFDAAAAPGGKSFTLMAAEPSVDVVLGDIAPERLMRLRANLERLGRQAPTVLADAGRPPLSGSFDRVILDLPCSGTGTLRKHPELKWRISPGEIGRLVRQAHRMLEGSASLVAPGGLLIAITCSLEVEENEELIGSWLGRRKEFLLEPLEEHLAYPLDRSIIGPGAWRLLTGGDHDGFTVHVMRRRGPRPV